MPTHSLGVGRSGYNQATSAARAQHHGWSMRDWLHWLWNSTESAKGPYCYFGGALVPVERDEAGDLVYEYQGE